MFDFSFINPDELDKALSKLKYNSSAGNIGIADGVLKKCRK